jgi:N-acetylmuramoyl-L-alanine amidase
MDNRYWCQMKQIFQVLLRRVKICFMNIISIPSPNFTSGRKIYSPEAVVIHIMEGTLAGTDSWFKNPQSKVSAHYGIGKSGEVHQYVRETDTAWHAGRVNAPSWQLIKPAGNGLFINPNWYTIGIEHEGNENSEWSDAMYNSSSEMIRSICNRWNIPIDRNHIIGHHDIYSLKTCPGSRVSLNKLIALASGRPVDADTNGIEESVQPGNATTKVLLNIRSQPDTSRPPVARVPAGIQLSYDGFTNNGEKVNGNSKWFFTQERNWFWSGGVK